MYKVGLDPGFGGFKAARMDNSTVTPYMHVVNIPAIVGTGETSMGMLAVPGVVTGPGGMTPHTIKWENTTLLVGPNVHTYGRVVERLDFNRLKNGPELRALTYTALGMLFGPGQSTLSLVIGLPVEVLDGDQAGETVRSLRKWLRGRQAFAIDQEFYVLEIKQIRAVAQPIGSFLDWGFDDYGIWCRSKDELKAPTGVMDIGFNSVDLLGVENGRISRRYTGGQNLGVRRAAEIIRDRVQQSYNRRVSFAEADEMIREFVKTRGRSVQLAIPGGMTSAHQLVGHAIDMAAGELLSYTETQWGNGAHFSRILITGGGAHIMSPRVMSNYQHAEVMPQPAEANARGLAKLANRNGFLQ